MTKDVSTDLKLFVHSRIESMTQLEILLLLFSTRPEEWGAAGVSAHLRNNEASVAAHLKKLQLAGLARVRSEDEIELYRYADHDRDQNQRLEELAEAHRTMRFRLIALIFHRDVSSE